MGVLESLRAGLPRPRVLPGPVAAGPALSWIGDERIAISAVPSARVVAGLAEQGVTHVVNCRPRAQVRWSGDLAAERAAFGPERVAHAPMQDHGLRQRPAAWAPAACFAAQVLEDLPQAGVLIHCTAGRRRSVMVTYAVLRLRGHDRAGAAALVLRYRTEAVLVPAYVRSVEQWLATAGLRPGRPAPGRGGR
jgi:protein-tyrosine phosphatase